MPDSDLYESKAMMRYLLNDDPEAQSRIAGMEAVDEKERLFLLCSCSAQIIVHTICRIAGHNKNDAQHGFSSLISVMEEQVERICDLQGN